MRKTWKFFIILIILLVSVGFVSASDENVTGCNDTALSVEDSLDDVAPVVIGDADLEGGDILGGIDSNVSDDGGLKGVGSDNGPVLGDSGNAFGIVNGNVSRYDFDDVYKIKVVDGLGSAVYGGHVDFFVNHELVGTSPVSYLGVASLNLNSCINTAGTYEIVSIYYPTEENSNGILSYQNIEVDHVSLEERDIQVIFENIKLYDLGEEYRVKVVDINGNPVKKGYVCFLVYDRILFSNLSDSGIATCVLPRSLNFTGNLVVWSVYSDGELYDFSVYEQITIGTRTLVSLDKTSVGARMITSWNRNNYTYSDGSYVARISDKVSHVIEWTGNSYIIYESTVTSSADLKNHLFYLYQHSNYDVVRLNLLSNQVYNLDYDVWSDKEWDYAGKFSFGQLIINGNGSTITTDKDMNFLYIGSEANVCVLNTTLKKFNHCFMNHGSLLCRNCIFINNTAFKTDVLEEGSGSVVHNYNTAVLENCGFYDNNALAQGFTQGHMSGSILYGEPHSLNVIKDFYGHFYQDSLYCSNYSTTIIFDDDDEYQFQRSIFAPDAYFVMVHRNLYDSSREWVVNVTTVDELISVFNTINSFLTATSVVINLKEGNYKFTKADYDRVRAYDWRNQYYYQDPYINVNLVRNEYLLDVGFCPVTINGNFSTISIEDNDESDDYHFAYIGKYGSLTLKDLYVEKFNTAFYVGGTVTANNVMFRHNVIDYTMLSGDYGGVFRSFGGSIICKGCLFTSNGGDDVDGHQTKDIYAVDGSYVELVKCNRPEGIVKDSYLKCSNYDKTNIGLLGSSTFERFEENYEISDFKSFNVSDQTSYNAMLGYLNNHSVSSILVNFTGDYNFAMPSQFTRAMAVVFKSNGYDVRFSSFDVKSHTSMNFIGFVFNNVRINNYGTSSFYNCSFCNNRDCDYFFYNKGSCSLINCSIFNNNCEDYSIYNVGSMDIYDSFFSNNNFDDDYGVIYNERGSVSTMNTSFSEGGTHIHNFETGDCAVSNAPYSTRVEYEQPWSNYQKDVILTVFMFGTAMMTFGSGAAIGTVLPGVAGLVVTSLVGAGIGFGSGIAFGVIEGNVYHDYSGVWKRALSFAVFGLSMAQVGWSTTTTFANNVNDDLNNRPNNNPSGGGEGANPQNPNPGRYGANELFKDPAFQEALENYIQGDLDNIEGLRGQYPELVEHISKTYETLSINTRANAAELLNLLSTMQSVLAARSDVVGPQPNNIINAVNRVENNVNNNINIDNNEVENPLIREEGFHLADDIMNQAGYLRRSIEDSDNLRYLRGVIYMSTYSNSENNRSHTDRVLDLLIDFAVLQNQVRRLGFMYMSSGMISFMNLYNDNLGARANHYTVNSLFNSSTLYRLEAWEKIYQSALAEFESIKRAAGIDDSYFEQGNANVSEIVNLEVVNLLNVLDGKFNEKSVYKSKYDSLKQMYNENFVNQKAENLDLLLIIRNELRQLNSVVDINVDAYDKITNFDYISLIKKNVYNGLFNRPDTISKFTHIEPLLFELRSNMKYLQMINPELYADVIRDVFGGTDFNTWLAQVNTHDDAYKVNAYKIYYRLASDYLIIYRDSGINERDIDFYHIKHLFAQYMEVYNALSDSDKVMVNKYLYEQCCELIKTYNGVHYMFGKENLTDKLNEVSNINDISRNNFKKLSDLYSILMSSRGNKYLFNDDISALDSRQIADHILDDFPLLNLMDVHYKEIYADYYSTDSQFVYLTYLEYLAENDQIDILTSMYNFYSEINRQLILFYTFDYNLNMEIPLDMELFKNFTHIRLNRIYLGNDLGNSVPSRYFHVNFEDVIQTMIRTQVVYLFRESIVIPQDASPEEADRLEGEKMRIQNMINMLAFNRYMKNKNLYQISNLLDVMFVEGSANIPYHFVYGPEYYLGITSHLEMTRQQVILLQQQINPDQIRMFYSIDVAGLSTRLSLFREACPVGFNLLMDDFKDKYNQSFVNHSMWSFDNQRGEFCILDKQGNMITYYDFCNALIAKMDAIIHNLGVLDENNNILYDGVSYEISRFANDDNPYYDIFNKLNYFDDLFSDDALDILLEEMESNMNYLRVIDRDLYDSIMYDTFNKSTFAEWVNDCRNSGKLNYHNLYTKYTEIFNKLANYRDSSNVLDNEIKVIISQLDSRLIANMENQEIAQQIRSFLLYFIYYWEVSHEFKYREGNLNEYAERQIVSVDLMNRPLEEIYARYNEIVALAIYHVFDDDVDVRTLSTVEVRNLFLNNLYRAYHSPERFAVVFDILKAKNIHFNEFRDYVNYFNSISDRNTLIDLYNLIQSRVVPSQESAKPQEKVNDIVITRAQLDDIIRIMEDRTLSDNPNFYEDFEMDLCHAYGSWLEFQSKYGDISKYVLENLLGGDFLRYTQRLGWNQIDRVRSDIIQFLENAYAHPPVSQGELVLNDEQFKEIKNILEDNTIYPTKTHNVVSDSMVRLYGSWDLLEIVHPDVADRVRQSLFNNRELYYYASENGVPSNDYRSVRQIIIEFIRSNYYKGQPASENQPESEEMDVSKYSVTDIYRYVQARIVSSGLEKGLADDLLKSAETIFHGYVGLMDIMMSAHVPEEEYASSFNQFKVRLLEILKIVDANNPVNAKYDEIKLIMEAKNLEPEMIVTSTDQNYVYFLGSWYKLETDHADIAAYILEKYFKSNMEILEEFFKQNGDDETRRIILEHIKEYLVKNSANANPDSNPVPEEKIEKFVIEKEDFAGANLDQIKVLLKNAFDKANANIDIIRVRDPDLAESLRQSVKELYDKYLVRVASYNHQYQYIQFMENLNKLFEGIDASNYVKVHDANIDFSKFVIKKDSTKDFTNEKFKVSMKKAIDKVDEFTGQIDKTNNILAKRIHDKAHELYDKYLDYVLVSGAYHVYYYKDFINKVNEMFRDSVKPASQPPKAESAATDKISNQEILAQIKKTLAQKLPFPEVLAQRYNELKNSKNPDRQDLLDLLQDVSDIYDFAFVTQFRREVITEKITLFNTNDYATVSKLKNYKNSMSEELNKIKAALPNLYNSLEKTFDLDLKKISNLEQAKQLRLDMMNHCLLFLKLHRFDDGWFKALAKQFKNNNLKNAFKTYFRTTGVELGFTKNLDGADSATIKDYIRAEMKRIKNTDSDLHSYYIKNLFKGKSVENFFKDLDSGITPDQMDANYQELYKNIQDYIQPSRDILNNISEYKYDNSKMKECIESFEDASGCKLDTKQAAFTKVLLKAIVNINSYTLKTKLSKLLMSGVSPDDGSIELKTKQTIVNEILKLVGINRQIDDDEFEFLVDILNFNFDRNVRSLLLVDYVKVVNGHYNAITLDYQSYAEYQKIKYEILRFKALNVYKTTMYKDELEVIKVLRSLKCYGIMNKFLETKLISKYRNLNVIENDYVAGIINDDLKNTIEYQIALKGSNAVVKNLKHINVYYEVFNNQTLPKTLQGLADLIQRDMDVLYQKDPTLYDVIRDNFFEGRTNMKTLVKLMDYPENEKYFKLLDAYKTIYRYLGNWRDNSVVAICELLQNRPNLIHG